MNTEKRIRIGIISMIAGVLFMSASCTKDNMATPGPGEVFIQNMQFTPASITISVGETVTWTNKDNMNHTVTSNNGVFDSGTLNDGKTFAFTFANAGTYNYHCTLHGSMTGTIIVQL